MEYIGSLSALKYGIISPVKDESAYIRKTLDSVVAQSVKPEYWVIVDDGSKDDTPLVINGYAEQHPWIHLIKNNRKGPRLPGVGVIDAFNYGYRKVRSVPCDYIVKLDCDISFRSDYFEKLFFEFNGKPTLGIASGRYLEKRNSGWLPVGMPDYHAAGASKVMRKGCFDQIGGFCPTRGWDTIDEIKAQTLGWNTRHFKSIEFLHHKNEGSGIGSLRTSRMHGEIYYLTGGGFPFFVFKCLHRMSTGRPVVLSGMSLLVGYLSSAVMRKPKLVNKEEERFYKSLLNKRIREKLVFVRSEGVPC